MSRPLRLEFPGALWHVTNRGNERKSIFRDDEDRRARLRLLGRTARIFGWRVHSWVFMGNHDHFVAETPEPNLARGMRQLNGITTQAFNRRHGRVGHLFQGRYKAILVQKERHFLELVRYVVLNPVRAKLCAAPGDWRWSSYRATAGLEPAPEWFERETTLARFGTIENRAEVFARYRRFVDEGMGQEANLWTELKGQVFLGDENFLLEMEALIERDDALRRAPEIARSQRFPARRSVEAIAAEVAAVHGIEPDQLRSRQRRFVPARRALALQAREATVSLRDIAEWMQVSPWTVSHLAGGGKSGL